jgi:hypothetical protein
MALYSCMTSIQHHAVRRCTFTGGISLAIRYSDRGPSPRSPAPPLGRHNRKAAAGPEHPDTKVGALVREGVLRAEAAR